MSDPARIELPFNEGLLDLPAGPVLFIRPSADIPQDLAGDGFTCEQGFKPVAEQLQARGFHVVPRAEGGFAMVMMELTRSRIENMANFARAYRLAQPGGRVLVSGNKTDGVDSMLKAVRKIVDIEGVLSKSHGKVFWGIAGESVPELQAWEDAASAKENPAGYLTAPGMFSPDKIDKGSELLVQYFDKSIKGGVADLGAGWGYLSKQVLAACDKITALDVIEAEYSALEAAKTNVPDPRATFHWADATTFENPGERYHAVICNPPFHQGRAAEPSIGVAFIAAAAGILRPSGQLLMVANRQLPYEPAFEAYFKHWEILYQDKGFKVIRARRPKQAR